MPKDHSVRYTYLIYMLAVTHSSAVGVKRAQWVAPPGWHGYRQHSETARGVTSSGDARQMAHAAFVEGVGGIQMYRI